MKQYEANFDGLVGPSHNYAGLSFGNVASLNNANAVSNPKQAAKQGLAKMKALADMGMLQGVLAPQERPDVNALRRLGFTGSDSQVLESAAKQAPEVFLNCCSASSMWTANAATVSPSADTCNGKIHFTPANLTNKFHRSLEPEVTGRILAATFNNSDFFEHHLHLPENDHFGDEGAANHTRLCAGYGEPGLELFTYGRYAFNSSKPAPTKFPARQTIEASQAIARLHGLNEQNTVFMQQNPAVIDQGVFHNDVIAVGNRNVLFYHEQAFLDTQSVLSEIEQKFAAINSNEQLHFIEVPTAKVSINDAVKTYLFNTQIINMPSGEMAIIAPTECQENPAVSAYLAELVTLGTPIKKVHFFDVKQSMQNGGGPACLRLRVALNEREVAAVNPNTWINQGQIDRLNAWVDQHYRDRLSIADLSDPAFLVESRTALDELTQILNLGSVYPFQRV
ncbi:N-succinylarginine dihydrolase [Endozoicomonas sp. G2_1]|uniref:N-succinylarginine dihydrolase n=1 Tax=Endozoicomonas sp. G2_1 TaxID=2821091 RepID=UPI001ADC477E|nr:N-succinylarginine dihydrolase [Endozoicomonas sp. G2_1]MBO9491259.1 N-succinylarginine dihydrolase [Endozoicomonas sp. G2_1]